MTSDEPTNFVEQNLKPPSLEEQMKAYLQMCKDTGRELTEEQKKMLAEIEGEAEDDPAILGQTGRIDYGYPAAPEADGQDRKSVV